MFKALRALVCVFLVTLVLGQNAFLHLPARETSQIEGGNGTKSLDVRNCPGYKLDSLKQSSTGLTARLTLAGAPCNAFGADIAELTIEVTYETSSRLHVKISDTANQQYTIPESVIALPGAPKVSFTEHSDLVFEYQASPFVFWITRRSQPQATPLFDTRPKSLPSAPVPPLNSSDKSTALDSFALIFEDQYLQLASGLPANTNIYGLGEVVASSGFRRDINSTVQTLWARDVGDPVDENVYGSHPIYLEHRFDQATKSSQSHGVFLFNAAGGDIILRTPAGSDKSLIEYRMIGGILDFYFLSGPTPKSVVEQYGALIGLPTWQPAWGFGFHLCRWGYNNISVTREQVVKMREANIPLEVMWNDIDLYHAVRDFTNDPVSFPADEVRKFIRELASNNQHYIPIVDAAVAKQVNATDIYDPYTKGVEKDVFIKNPDGTEYVGQVWPGYTVFPDWFQKNTQQWWTEALKNWSQSGVEFSGIWLDMNEASSFCAGSCGSGIDISNTTAPFILPGNPGNLVVDYPECYNSTIFGPSGNITINGTLTCNLDASTKSSLAKRGLGAGKQKGVDITSPPYAIHNGFGPLSKATIATNATHADGQVELDVHNLWGLMEEKATHLAVQEVNVNQRPFLISRSTFASSGKWTGHWLGDNFSLWSYLRHSISGILQFQLFQIPFVGADTCGFNGNTDEELCNRWTQLSAFTPFYRNHNSRGSLSQEPYRWDSVAQAARTAIAVRYSLLPYWYTLFAASSTSGTPPVRALFFEFPDEPELYAVDTQFLVGADILVTPVMLPNETSVSGFFPGHGNVTWRDWYTHEVVNSTPGQQTKLDAPLGHINVHIRDGSVLLLHAKPAYTIAETRQGPYSLLVSLDSKGEANGLAYVDDGISNPPGPSRSIVFAAQNNALSITGKGDFKVESKLQDITILGIKAQSNKIKINGKTIANSTYDATKQKLTLLSADADLNQPLTFSWA